MPFAKKFKRSPGRPYPHLVTRKPYPILEVEFTPMRAGILSILAEHLRGLPKFRIRWELERVMRIPCHPKTLTKKIKKLEGEGLVQKSSARGREVWRLKRSLNAFLKIYKILLNEYTTESFTKSPYTKMIEEKCGYKQPWLFQPLKEKVHPPPSKGKIRYRPKHSPHLDIVLLLDKNPNGLTIREICQKITSMKERQIRRHLKKLKNMGVIFERVGEKTRGTKIWKLKSLLKIYPKLEKMFKSAGRRSAFLPFEFKIWRIRKKRYMKASRRIHRQLIS